jgi:hypothetical protein
VFLDVIGYQIGQSDGAVRILPSGYKENAKRYHQGRRLKWLIGKKPLAKSGN